MIDFIIDTVMPIVLGIMLIGVMLLMFVFLPAHMMNEAECLERGYPVTSTTFALDGYCMNTEGAIRAEVVKL